MSGRGGRRTKRVEEASTVEEKEGWGLVGMRRVPAPGSRSRSELRLSRVSIVLFYWAKCPGDFKSAFLHIYTRKCKSLFSC